MNTTAYSVIIFFDTFLIREIRIIKILFEVFHGNLVPRKFQTSTFEHVMDMSMLLHESEAKQYFFVQRNLWVLLVVSPIKAYLVQ